jgi:hypothetical protein
MANVIRIAKSGSEWTGNDLIAYNINIVDADRRKFFGDSWTDNPNVSTEILSFDIDDGDRSILHKDARRVLAALDLATSSRRESLVDDFSRDLLILMDYDSISRTVGTRRNIDLIMCSVITCAQVDVCVESLNNTSLLLLQEDKTNESFKDPEPQVIAEAIAAFQENNRIRSKRFLNPLDMMIFPCITMRGTFPVFYLVPITKNLSDCIKEGKYPERETTVLRHTPKVKRSSDGMRPTENKKRILSCFESFRRFVDDLEKEVGEDF